MFNVRIDGLHDVDTMLGQLGPALAKGAMKLALERAAQPLVQAARQMAPFDEDRKKGKHLRDTSVATTRLRGRQRRFVDAGFAHVFVGPTGKAATVAHLLEFGHAIVARGPNRDHVAEARRKVMSREARRAGKNADPFLERLRQRELSYRAPKGGRGGYVIGHVPARPFMRPAWDLTKHLVLEEFRKQIVEILLATARGARVASETGTLDRRAGRSLVAA